MNRQVEDPPRRDAKSAKNVILLGALGVLAVVSSLRAADNDWPMFRGNSQLTGIARGSLPEKLTVRWKFQAPDAITGTAAIVNGTVYVGSEDGTFFAIDLATGSQKWKFSTSANAPIKSSPLVTGGLVLFGDDDGLFHALDVATGAERWSFKAEDSIISSANYEGDRIVFGSYDGSVYCLEAGGGKLLWKYVTDGKVHGSPAIVEGNVIVAGCDAHLHVIRLSDGQAVRKVQLDSVSGASAAALGHCVFVGTYDHQVHGIDWSAGTVLWTFEDPDRQFPFLSSAAVFSSPHGRGQVAPATRPWRGEGMVILGGRDKRLRALNPNTGKLIWEFVAKGRIDSSPVIVGDRVFVGSSDGNLYALDVSAGTEKWRFEAGAPISASPAIALGCLVIGTEDGILYCFGDTGNKL